MPDPRVKVALNLTLKGDELELNGRKFDMKELFEALAGPPAVRRAAYVLLVDAAGEENKAELADLLEMSRRPAHVAVAAEVRGFALFLGG